MAAATEKHKLPPGAVVAEGKGQCGKCRRPIGLGELFYWRGDTPAWVECSRCRDKRLKQARLDRDAGKG